ncbi:MAG: hypothetical protein HYZ53_09685 [Planctomycetes bacterium]|nr:hypothetical protein [Planctomycetota bacterium]
MKRLRSAVFSVAVAFAVAAVLTSCTSTSEPDGGAGAAAGDGARGRDGAKADASYASSKVGEVKVVLFSISQSANYNYVGAYIVLLSEAWAGRKRPLQDPFTAISIPSVKTVGEKEMAALLDYLEQRGFYGLPQVTTAPVARFKNPTTKGAVLSVTRGNRTWMVDRDALNWVTGDPLSSARLKAFVEIKEAIAGVFASVHDVRWKATQDPWQDAFKQYLKRKPTEGQR